MIKLAALAIAACVSVAAHAQSYPAKPVRLVVGYAAGGANDSVARVLAPKLQEALGQPVLVENKLGAAGMIAAEQVARSDPDGHTLLFAASSMFTTNPVMFAKVPYTLDDFAPITTTVTFPFFVVVRGDNPARSIKDLVAQMKANPAKANNAGAAGVHQLAFALFKAQTGAPGEYVSYKGTNLSVGAVMSGDVLMTIADAGGVAPALGGGKVRAVAVTSAKRAPGFPDVPTTAEAGYPKLEMESWMGVLAPKGTSPAVVKRLQDEVQKIVRSEFFQERMKGLHVDPHTSTPQEFATMIRTGLADWQAVARAAGIQPQ